MKKFLNIYRTFKMPIKASIFGFVLIAIGFLIKNENVNLFYTFRNPIVLFLGELSYKIGELIVMNLPLIFMIAGVSKKANNTSVIITAFVGYFTFLVTMMLFGTQTLSSQAYTSSTGINSIFNIPSGVRLPFETGLLGSLAVAYVTRISFILSRYRGRGSILHLFSKDSMGMALNIVFCFLLGLIVSYVYPYAFSGITNITNFIADDLSDPQRIGLFAALDRFLSVLGLGNIIKYPFWYTSLGGSYLNTSTGQVILGDVNIWTTIKNVSTGFVGAGRFTTYYYVVNIFIVPAVYVGMLMMMTDKKDRRSLLVLYGLGIILSILAGNPLLIEMVMIATSPVLFVMYLVIVALSASALSYLGAYIGFSPITSNITISTPGSLADLLVNIRNANLNQTVMTILYIGLLAFVITLITVMLFYRFFAYDFSETGNLKNTVEDIIDAIGGKENIKETTYGLFKIHLVINNHEIISYDKLRNLDVGTISESKTGLSIECGVAGYRISRLINKTIKTATE